MRVVLVDPAPRRGIREAYESLGIAHIASFLRAGGHEVTLISSALRCLSVRATLRAIRKADAEVIGFSVLEVHAKRALAMVDALRDAGSKAHITLGGHFPTFNHKKLLRRYEGIDSIVRGEGERTFLELVERLSHNESLDGIEGLSFREVVKIQVNPPRALIEDLDTLPFPARDFAPLVLRQHSPLSISASRGCYANCSFCSIRAFYDQSPGPKWRTRSPERVVDEMEALVQRFGRSPIGFVDDQFVGPGKKGKEWAVQLGEEILRRKLGVPFTCSCRVNDIDPDLFGLLKEAGLTRVFIGIESGTERGLLTFNKRTTIAQNVHALATLDKLGIGYKIGFIFFDPYTTFEEVKQNFRFLSDIAPYWMKKRGMLSIEPSLIVHDGTPIHARLKRENRLSGTYLRHGYRIEDRKARIAQIAFQFFVKKTFVFYFAFLRYARERLYDGVRTLRRGGARLGMRFGESRQSPKKVLDKVKAVPKERSSTKSRQSQKKDLDKTAGPSEVVDSEPGPDYLRAYAR